MQAARRALKEERHVLDAALMAAEVEGDDARIARMRERIEEQDSILRRLYTASRTEGFGEEVKRRIMLGTYVLSSGYYDAYYAKGQRVRTLIRRDFDEAFEKADVLLTPVTPSPAFKIGAKVNDPLEMYLSDVYTVNANLAGIPGLSIPIGNHPEAGLPVGGQLLGRHFEEGLLLRVGHFLETNDLNVGMPSVK
jgi:aspartyl-tRNA(Asn)/glutamyl-tRNA(Gln) amidotransferase subunit A